MSSFIIALVGAESTGKSTLARELCRILIGQGVDAVVVSEYLREFCEQHQRTPFASEQAQIAHEQTRRIHEAAQTHEVVLADTTALMTAVYSDYIFGDTALYAPALQDHAMADLTLLMSLDVIWVADEMRDGDHAREPVDHLLRTALQNHGLSYTVVAGRGGTRVQHALSAIEHLMTADARRQRTANAKPWRWYCEDCGDGDCEQHTLGIRDDV